MSMIKCSECQSEFSDELQSCPNCGCPVIEENKSTDNEILQYGKPESKKSSKKIIIIVTIVAVLVICLISVFTGIKLHSRQIAVELNITLETLTKQVVSDKINNELMPYGQLNNLDMDEVEKLQNDYQNIIDTYNGLNDYQNNYISDTAKENVEYLEKIISSLDQLKEMKQMYDEQGMSAVKEKWDTK